MIRPYHIFITLFVAACLIQACKKKDKAQPRWDTEILAPLVKTSMSVKDFLPDTAYVVKPDQSLSLVYSQPLYALGLDSLIKLDIPPFTTTQTVESLKINSDVVEYKLTLADLARQLIANGESEGQRMLDRHGYQYLIPRIPNQSVGPISVDISDILISARILSGTLSLEIINDFSLSLANIEMNLSNASDNSAIVSDQIPSLHSGTSFGPVLYDLAGKQVEGALNIHIPNVDLLSGYRLIDTNMAFTVRLMVSDLIVDEATTVFPAQDLISWDEDTPLESMGEARLVKAKLKEGKITLSAQNSADVTINYEFSVPVATKNGIPFRLSGQIPAANGSSPGHITLEHDFAGYEIDLRGQSRNLYNVIHNSVKVSINETNTPVTLSRSDYVSVQLAFENVRPFYVEGFLGKDTIGFGPGEVKFDLFENFNVEEVSFKKLNLSIDFVNGLGMEGDLEIEQLTASNGSTTRVIENVANGTIRRALTNPVRPVMTTINADGANPGPEELLSLQPDKIGYKGKIYLNRGASEYDLTGFAYDTSTIRAYVNMELPFHLSARKFVLTDTADFSASLIEEPIGQGELGLLVWNGYPLDADIKLIFLNEDGSEADRLVSGREIKAGVIDPAAGRVNEKMFSRVTFPMDLARVNTILETKKVVFKMTFWTMPEDSHVRIFADYRVDLSLVGDFEYRVMNK